MEITPATPRASADGGLEEEDYGAGARPNEGILGGFFRRRRRPGNDDGATAPTATASTATSSSRPRPRPSSSSDESPSVLLLLSALLIALAIVAGLHWSALSGMERNSSMGAAAAAAAVSTSSSTSSPPPPPAVFSPGQLLASTAADGETERPPTILVAFAGEVFDVGPRNRHYGPGGDYSRLAGRDATRAFVSGDFENDLGDGVGDLLADADAVQSLEHWLSFYENHKEYKKVGVVEGSFFDGEGRKKSARVELERAVEEFRRRRKPVKE